jgi:aldehyde:ferredoxin oxidoreductase
VGPERLAQIVNSALGWDWTPEEVLTMGDRLFQLKRLINLRLGITGADDVLPARLVTEPRPSGHAAGVLPEMELMMPVYYELRDWDEDGVPRQQQLEKLGLI